MFYKLNNFVFVRNKNDRLFLVNKIPGDTIYGDKSAYIFFQYLTYEPQELDKIVKKIASEFIPPISESVIKNDVESFLEEFVEKKIVSKGNTFEECNKNETRFSYLSVHEENIASGKISEDSEKLIEIAKEDSQNPALIYMMLEITKECNERCLHCYIPHENKNIMMKDSDFYRIVEECKELGTVCSFRISGGECMTHPSFKKFIKYIKDNGFHLTVISNLTLLDDEIINILKSGTLSDVQVSLFSLDEKVHDKITTVPGSLRKTLFNLDKLYNADIPVSIATQAMELNKESIKDLFNYAYEHKFRMNFDWTIVAKEDVTTDNLNYRIKDMSFYSNLCNARVKFSKNYLDDFKKSFPQKRNASSFLCNAGMNGVQITPDLLVHPCPGWSIKLGDLNVSSLKDVWDNSEELKRIRQIRLGDFGKCVGCDKNSVCHICMSQAYNESNGKFEMPDYVCEMYEVIKNTLLVE